MDSQKKYDVFISCKSEDYALAREIHDFLTNKGYSVFLADADLRKVGKARYGKVIDEALESATHLVLFASKPQYAVSTYVEEEWRIFLEEQRSGRKSGNLLTVRKGFDIAELPISLRGSQSFAFDEYEAIVDFLPMSNRKSKMLVSDLTKNQRQPRKSFNSAILKKVLIAVIVLSCVVSAVVGGALIVDRRTSAPYVIGDYYNDGKKKGVVFEITDDGKHGKIVSLTELNEGLQWTSNKIEQKRLIGCDDRLNGANNMAKVKQIAGWREKYPAFAWCADLGDSWYVPAIEELKKFTINAAVHDAVNCTLETKGEKLANKGVVLWYWSSTEGNVKSHLTGEFCAWGVDVSDGGTNLDYKPNYLYVRAVSAF